MYSFHFPNYNFPSINFISNQQFFLVSMYEILASSNSLVYILLFYQHSLLNIEQWATRSRVLFAEYKNDLNIFVDNQPFFTKTKCIYFTSLLSHITAFNFINPYLRLNLYLKKDIFPLVSYSNSWFSFYVSFFNFFNPSKIAILYGVFTWTLSILIPIHHSHDSVIFLSNATSDPL